MPVIHGTAKANVRARALTNQVATCSKLKATTKKLESIKRKQRSLQATAVTTKQSIDTALDDYAKVLCRCFCEDVYRRFPREVRDMIYGYMYPIDSFPVTAAFFTADHPRLDHWRFADFVGSDMHQELGEHFFRSTYFTFGPTMTCLDLIPKFRMVDEAKLGYVPAYFVAHVQIDINCDNLRASRWTNPDEWDTHKKTRKFDSDILSNLELLFGFQQGTKLLLRFRKSSDDSDSWSASYLDDLDWLCENIAPLISPTVQRYNVAGYGVVVAFASGFDQAGEYSFIPDPVPSSALAWKAEFARVSPTDWVGLSNRG